MVGINLQGFLAKIYSHFFCFISVYVYVIFSTQLDSFFGSVSILLFSPHLSHASQTDVSSTYISSSQMVLRSFMWTSKHGGPIEIH